MPFTSRQTVHKGSLWLDLSRIESLGILVLLPPLSNEPFDRPRPFCPLPESSFLQKPRLPLVLDLFPLPPPHPHSHPRIRALPLPRSRLELGLPTASMQPTGCFSITPLHGHRSRRFPCCCFPLSIFLRPAQDPYGSNGSGPLDLFFLTTR